MNRAVSSSPKRCAAQFYIYPSDVRERPLTLKSAPPKNRVFQPRGHRLLLFRFSSSMVSA